MANESIRRRLAAILAADVVGYSRLMEQDESNTHTLLMARWKEVLEPLVARHQGRVFKRTGDGALVEFGSAVNAVECAAALQQAMAAANDGMPGDRAIVLRVGVNLGDIMVEDSDLYGDGVNVAARLQTLASPGGVAISDSVHDHVRGRVSLDFADSGRYEVKNIARPVHVWSWAPHGAGDAIGTIVGAEPRLPAKPSIAVLPFDNMSGEPEQAISPTASPRTSSPICPRFPGSSSSPAIPPSPTRARRRISVRSAGSLASATSLKAACAGRQTGSVSTPR